MWVATIDLAAWLGAHTASTLSSVMSILWQVHAVVANYMLSICNAWWTDANKCTYMERWKHHHDSEWMPWKLQVYAYKEHARKPHRKIFVWGQNQVVLYYMTWNSLLFFSLYSAGVVIFIHTTYLTAKLFACSLTKSVSLTCICPK